MLFDNNKKIYFAVIIVTLIFLTLSCESRRRHLLDNQINAFKQTNEFSAVYNNFNDTIEAWADSGYTGFVSIKLYKTDNKIGPIIFDKNKERCLILFFENILDDSVKLNQAKLVAGELIDGQWRFYSNGLPAFTFYKFIGERSEQLFNRMENEILQKMIKGGLVEWYGFNINDIYIKDWFTPNIYERVLRYKD